MKKNFEHDCTPEKGLGCAYCGSLGTLFDFYLHVSSNGDATCITRYGSEGHEYYSWPIYKLSDYVQAARRAMGHDRALKAPIEEVYLSIVLDHTKTAFRNAIITGRA